MSEGATIVAVAKPRKQKRERAPPKPKQLTCAYTKHAIDKGVFCDAAVKDKVFATVPVAIAYIQETYKKPEEIAKRVAAICAKYNQPIETARAPPLSNFSTENAASYFGNHAELTNQQGVTAAELKEHRENEQSKKPRAKDGTITFQPGYYVVPVTGQPAMLNNLEEHAKSTKKLCSASAKPENNLQLTGMLENEKHAWYATYTVPRDFAAPCQVKNNPVLTRLTGQGCVGSGVVQFFRKTVLPPPATLEVEEQLPATQLVDDF